MRASDRCWLGPAEACLKGFTAWKKASRRIPESIGMSNGPHHPEGSWKWLAETVRCLSTPHPQRKSPRGGWLRLRKKASSECPRTVSCCSYRGAPSHRPSCGPIVRATRSRLRRQSHRLRRLLPKFDPDRPHIGWLNHWTGIPHPWYPLNQ